MTFDCPFCTYEKEVPDSYKNKKLKCPRCLATITLGVPQPTTLTALAPTEEEENTPVESRAIELDQPHALEECPFCFEMVNVANGQCPNCGRFMDQETKIIEGGQIPKGDSSTIAFYLSLVSLVCGIGILLGPLAMGLAWKARREMRNSLRVEGWVNATSALILGLAGTVGSLLLLVGLLVAQLRLLGK